MLPDVGFELRHLRTFVTVAKYGSFTRAAMSFTSPSKLSARRSAASSGDSGPELLSRSSRSVTLTSEGKCSSLTPTAFCPQRSAQADASARQRGGSLGALRLAYTLTTAWETLPVLVADLAKSLPHLKIDAREVFGGDIDDLLSISRAIEAAEQHAASHHWL